MPLTKCTTPVDNITKIGTTAFDRKMTTPEFKKEFDKSVTGIKVFLNDTLISELESTTDNSSGADKIGASKLKESGAETVGGQLDELYTGKVDKITGKGLSTNDFTNEDVQALANKVDKITGKGLSTNDFSDAQKVKLDGIAANANNYALPIASTTVVGGVKAGTSVEIMPDGTINGLAAPAPDLVAREGLANEITNRQNTDSALSTRIDNEITTRGQVDTNLQNQITANKKAENVNITEATRALYGLSTGDANVDKTLQKIIQGGTLSALLTGFSKAPDTGSIIATDNLLKALSKLSNNIKIVTGTYTGNGVANREIALGFAPNFVLLYENDSNFSQFMFKTSTACARYAVIQIKCAITPTFLCTNNGFSVGTGDYVHDGGLSSNNNGRVYNYLALAALA